jgi:hypothetical protein
MLRFGRPSRSFRILLQLGVGVAIGVTAGCSGESDKPKVKPGDTSTTYNVPPPPDKQEGKTKPANKQGSMSARELRDFKQKNQPAQP